MGADLIGYTVYGNITKAKINKAMKYAKKHREGLQRVLDAAIAYSDQSVDKLNDYMDEELEKVLKVACKVAKYKYDDLTGFIKAWECDHGEGDSTSNVIERLIDIMGDDDVETIIAAHHGKYRDSTWREIKVGKSKVQVSFCGEMSWGDSPDGLGYNAMRNGITSGILYELGLQ